MANLNISAVLQILDRATAPLRQIAGGSSRAAAALKATREQVKALQRQQSDINSFKRLTQGLSDTQRELVAARDKVNRMRAAVQATSNPSAKMLRELNQATEAVKRLKQAETDQIEQLNRVRQSLQRAGVDVNNLSQHEARLAADLARANRAMEQQQERLRRLNAANQQYQRTMQQSRELAGKGTGMIAAGAATGAVLSVPIKAYADNEDAATQLRVAMMKANGQVAPEFKAINDLANELGNSLPGTTADFQNMMAALVKQGISFKAILGDKVLGGVGKSAAYLAVQMKLPFEEAAEFAAKLQDATKTTEGDMMSLMDMIQRTYYLGVDKTNMLGGFSAIADGMKTIRLEGLEGAKAIAPLLVMADQNSMQGSTAGIAYSKIFSKMMDTKKITKSLKGTGIAVDFTDGKGEFGGLDKMYQQLAKFKNLSTEARKPIFRDLFGDDAETTNALNLLIDKGKAGYDDTLRKMAEQASLQQRVNLQLGTLKNLWDSATGTFTNAMASFGEAIAPELKALTEWIAKASEGMGNWAKENPILANSLMKFLGLLAIMLVVLGALTMAMAAVLVPFAMFRFMLGYLGMGGLSFIGILKGLVTALRVVFFAVMGLGRMLLANPIALAIMGIAVAALLIYKYWEPIKKMWDKWLVQPLSRAMEWVANLPSKFMAIGGQIVDGLKNGMIQKWANFKKYLGDIGDSISNTVKEKLGIKSPSRVFAEIGLHTMTGLQQGLINNQNAPLNTVIGLSKQLKQAATGVMLGATISTATATPLDTRPPLTPRAAATGSSNNYNYQITINASAGMDEKKLANLVMQKIKEAERQKQAAKRSSLIDTD